MTTNTLHFTIRRFRPEFDSHAIGQLYQASVSVLGAGHYEPEVIEAWRRWADHPHAVAQLLSQGMTLIAQHSGRIAAFGQRHPAGHINMLYTHPNFAQRGLGQALLEEMIDAAKREGLSGLSVDASRISRSLFEKNGFRGDSPEWVERDNLRIERFPMTLQFSGDR
ncbi:GNAT family N-acetyltransferase [Marinobacter bohaiensis]|uniref:GNAT family N-acetyltransferase n=1 Tax=Marinobacter bohaiensis TaxID=2201898 RepID=UPI000DACC067|nr:GNAT family N-acetyltransferase [Marinobacter bohaiensis]